MSTEINNEIVIAFTNQSADYIEEMGISEGDIQNLTLEIEEKIRSIQGDGKFSLGFVGELVARYVLSIDHIGMIMDELAFLEGNSSITKTKTESQFKGEILHPLWHKHYFQVRFIPHNLLNEMRNDNTVERVMSPFDGQLITEELIGKLTHELVFGNLESRSSEGRMTGEWIIYSKTNGRNYYFTFGSHLEGDQNIRDRVERYRLDGRYI